MVNVCLVCAIYFENINVNKCALIGKTIVGQPLIIDVLEGVSSGNLISGSNLKWLLGVVP